MIKTSNYYFKPDWKGYRVSFLFLLSVFCSLIAFSQAYKSRGVPSYPYPLEVIQPNGDTILLKGMGDGVVHWYETVDSKSVLKDENGYFVYAKKNNRGLMVPSKDIVQKKQDVRFKSNSLAPSKDIPALLFSHSQVNSKLAAYYTGASRKSTQNFPSEGSYKVLLVLVDFPDLPSSIDKSIFTDAMNKSGYNGTGSFRDYFLESSYNRLDLTTTVVEWVCVSKNMDYYGANDSNDDDQRPRELVREVVDSLEARGIDFSVFDNDGDGKLDGIQVIHAGYGEEVVGVSEDAIWSHSWALNDLSVTYDGVKINKYTIFPELRSNSGSNPTHIGVICHEFAHLLGLPDYYDTDYSGSGGSSFDIGDWDLMASGVWNNHGATPAGNNAFSKYLLGWLDLTELITPGQVSLHNQNEFPEAFIIQTATDNEFFILENRQQTGFDSAIPYHGMLIYHVDRNSEGWSLNEINVDPTYQAFDLEEADDLKTYSSLTGDPFPGVLNKTDFNDFTFPSSKEWDGNDLQKPISNIIEREGIVEFEFMSELIFNPNAVKAIPIGTSAIYLYWDKLISGDSVIVACSPDGNFGIPNQETVLTAGSIIDGGGTILFAGLEKEVRHLQLTADTKYYYKMWSTRQGKYSEGYELNASTYCNCTTLPLIEDFSGDTLPACWRVIDNIGNNDLWIFSNPADRVINTESAVNGFVILDSDYFGEDSKQNTDLISPLIDLSSYSNITLSFNHYFKKYESDTASLLYSIDGGMTFNKLKEWTTTTANPEFESIDVTSFVSGYQNVLFKWNYIGSYDWYWALDDIRIISPENSSSLEHMELSGISPYPNPSTGVLYLRDLENYAISKIRITSVQGSVVYERSEINGAEMQIDLTGQPHGLYFLVIESDNSIMTHKIILQ